MKFLSPRVHAPLDYVLVVLFALAPMLFGLAGVPAVICYAVAAAYLVMSLTTVYPLGVVKLIPFPVHGYVELVLAPLLAGSPWLFGFQELEAARNFFLSIGLAAAVLWLVTDYHAAELDESQRHLRRRYLGTSDHAPRAT